MDALEMFLYRHARLHSHVDRLLQGLRDQEIRNPAHPGTNSLAWLVWHMARSEDATASLLIGDVPQLLDDDWASRMNVAQRGVGTGMTAAEVMNVSANVHLPSLMAYWQAVGGHTRHAVQSLGAPELDQVVDRDQVHAAVEAMVTGTVATQLEAHFKDTSRGQFLVWLPLTHNYEHLGQADLIRGILGHPGNI